MQLVIGVRLLLSNLRVRRQHFNVRLSNLHRIYGHLIQNR
jgi:hypothetical protein